MKCGGVRVIGEALKKGDAVFRPMHYDLELWKEAMRLAVDVLRLTASFPVDERYGLSSQLRRSAVSIPSNIAEGAARGSRAELQRFLYISRGSLAELDTQLWLAREVGLEPEIAQLQERIHKVYGLLNGLMKKSRKPSQTKR